MDAELSQIFALFELTDAQASRYVDLRAEGYLQRADPIVDDSLISAGLAERRPDGIALASLRLALELRAAAMNEKVESARRAAIEMDSRSHSPTGSMCEVVYGFDAVIRAFTDIQRNAQTQIRSFDRGPYFHPPDHSVLSPVQEEVSGAGITYLTIIEHRSLEDYDTRHTVKEGLEFGESVRVIADLPLRLTIADDNVAMLVLPRLSPLAPEDPSDVDVLLVYPSAFLDGLISMFNSYWNLAVPVDLKSSDGTPELDNQKFLSLLAMGMTDSAVAQELNVSARTVQRRLNLLQHRVGAASRFQLGVQAVRQGLLDFSDAE